LWDIVVSGRILVFSCGIIVVSSRILVISCGILRQLTGFSLSGILVADGRIAVFRHPVVFFLRNCN
jgi:hypothetical protein